MKNSYFYILALILLYSYIQTSNAPEKSTQKNLQNEKSFTDIIISNTSNSSVKVYLTLQSPNSVIGLFGIKASDTTGSKSQGYFYAAKDSIYHINQSAQLLGWQISFEAPGLSCQQALDEGYATGINIIEGSINTEYEVFDVSCVDGLNSIVKVQVSDSLNWSTGDGKEYLPFKELLVKDNLAANNNIRGVFPYMCTDCIKINPKNIPKNCFNLPINCNSGRFCQVARTGHIGGEIKIVYLGKSKNQL